MQKLSLNAEKREIGRKALRDTRNAGKLPAVVYGGHIEAPVSVAVDKKTIEKIYAKAHNAILDLDVDGTKYTVVLGDIQRGIRSNEISHVDLHAVDPNDKLTIKAAIHLAGTAPGVKAGGVLETIHREVLIQCIPANIPDAIEVDVSNLNIGGSVHGSDVKLPEGVSYLHHMDEEVIVRCIASKVAAEATA